MKSAVARLCCLTLFLSFSLVSCGQRGPLYLPEPAAESASSESENAGEENSESNAEESDEEAT